MLAALLGAAWLAGCDMRVAGPRTETAQAPATAPTVPEAPAVAPAPAASAPLATAPTTPATPGTDPGVATAPEAVPPAGNPNVSYGHRAGLHRVKDPLRLTASAAIVVDRDTGEVLFEKNDEAVLPIASLTKLMTGIIVSEAKLPMQETITITRDDVDTERNSRSRLRVGTELTRADALHLALMSSENRAAHALARTYPGGMNAFVEAMNAKAKSLGMRETTFVDPTGLSNRNQSNAQDLAILAKAAAQHAMLREYSTTQRRQVTLGGRTLQYLNSNRLVKNPAWDISLQKTGYIVEAGQCVAMLTHLEGRDVVMVLLDAGDKRSRSADAERLRRWVESQANASSTHAGADRDKDAEAGKT